MRYKPLIAIAASTLILTITSGQARAGFAEWMERQWQAAQEAASGAADAAQETYEDNWDKLPGEITVCAAKELKGWMTEVVVPGFKKKAPRVTVKIEAHGSGTLVDAMNNGNTMQCDILIPGSDVSALRWKDYDINSKSYVAYSPTVWVGDKAKLDAARVFIGKSVGDPMSCTDLAKVAEQRRYGRIQEGGKGKVDLEMTTSNSGQTMYVSCVYSILDAIDPADVEDRLNADPAKEDLVREFFKVVKFSVPSTTTLTLKGDGQFIHPNGVGYKHLAIATYESLLPELSKVFADQGKQMEVIYPSISILNNFPAVRVTSDGKNGMATDAFVKYITGTEAQQAIVRYGFRPANPLVKYGTEPAAKFFNTDIEVGDAPSSQQMLRDLWDIVSDDPKAQAVQF